MSIFSLEEQITREYLKSKGFSLYLTNEKILVHKLDITIQYECMSFRCSYYFNPGIGDENDEFNYCPKISQFNLTSENKDFEIVTSIIGLEHPKTQFDMDMIIEHCIQLIHQYNVNNKIIKSIEIGVNYDPIDIQWHELIW